MADGTDIPTYSVTRFVGDTVKLRFTMDPAADVSGWTFLLEPCGDPQANWSFGGVTVEDSASGIFYWKFATDGWAPGAYHLRARRLTPDPMTLAGVYLTLLGC